MSALHWLRWVVVGLVAAAAVAQQAESGAGFVALHQALLDASTDGVVLNVAAHPDDEASRTNTILRRKHGLRVVTLYSTYGDGGQNAIGREIGPELAALRVRETLRAAALGDVEVRWLGMPDFGFSKTLEETLQVWGAERLKDRMRAELDRLDPDLVITNHRLDQGHGHHRASFWAIAAVLAERAAAGRHVPPLYVRCAVGEAAVTFDPGELEPARGETYARLAHRAWTQHVTQGPWGAHDPLQVGKDWWRLSGQEGLVDPAPDRPADLLRWVRAKDAGLERLSPADLRREPDELAALLVERWREARDRFETALREFAAVTAPPAGRGVAPRARLDALRLRVRALESALLALRGVRVEAWLEREEVALGTSGRVFLAVHGVERLQDLVVRCDGADAEPAQVAVRSSFFDGMPLPPPSTTPPPPESAEPPLPGTEGATASAATTRMAATVPGRLVATFTPETEAGEVPPGPEPRFVDVVVQGTLHGVPIQRLVTLWYTPVPALSITWDREVLMVPRGRPVQRLLTATVTNHRLRDAIASVRLSIGPGLTGTTLPGRLVLGPEHQQARLLVPATIDPAELLADAGIELGFKDAASRLRVVPVDVTVPEGLRVALVRGPDDSTERALADLGVPFEALDRDALVMARLEQFTTVLLDIRAYHHRPELAELRERLLEFVRGGGRVVAMYHKPGEWNERSGQPLLAPFPLTVGNERAVDEAASVTVLQPQHRLWQQPHGLTEADFTGWVQERGLNFVERWDPAWTPLLELRDPGDAKAHQGVLLHTAYGKGDFIYCTLALYRQLRNGHAGAARLLINLLAK